MEAEMLAPPTPADMVQPVDLLSHLLQFGRQPLEFGGFVGHILLEHGGGVLEGVEVVVRAPPALLREASSGWGHPYLQRRLAERQRQQRRGARGEVWLL